MKNYLVVLALYSMALAPSLAQADCDYSNGGQAYMVCLMNLWSEAANLLAIQQQAAQNALVEQQLQAQEQERSVSQNVYNGVNQQQQSYTQNTYGYSATYSCPYAFSCSCSDGSWPAYYTLGGSPVFGAGSRCCSAAQGGSC